MFCLSVLSTDILLLLLLLLHFQAEMDGHPDILLSLTTPSENTHLDYLTVHSSVQSADSIPYVDVLSPGGVAQIRKLRFSGIMESFTLCSYQASVPLIPIRGFYQMKVLCIVCPYFSTDYVSHHCRATG